MSSYVTDDKVKHYRNGKWRRAIVLNVDGDYVRIRDRETQNEYVLERWSTDLMKFVPSDTPNYARDFASAVMDAPRVQEVESLRNKLFQLERQLQDEKNKTRYAQSETQQANANSTQKQRELQENIKALTTQMQEQDKFLKELTEVEPIMHARVLDVLEDGKFALCAMGPGGVRILIPEKIQKQVKPGCMVQVAKTGGLVGVADYIPETGEIVKVKRVISDKLIEIERGTLGVTALSCGIVVEAGDQVVLDSMGLAVVKNLGKGENEYSVEGFEPLEWDGIGGQEEAKRALQMAIEAPVKHADVLKKYGKKPTKGILLYGPPGCGKTLLARAAATAQAQLHGKGGLSTGYIYVKGPEMLSKWVGQTEQNIREVFEKSRAHHKAHGYPAVLFIDEADALLPKRGSRRSSDVDATIVPQFLAEMDGLDATGAPLVLLATNRPDTLDPAVVREGRIDKKVKVVRPARNDAKAIVKIYLKSKPIEGHVGEMVEHAVDAFYSEEHVFYNVHLTTGEVKKFTLANLVNGAMLAQLVENSAEEALRRELEGKPSKGISKSDMHAAVCSIYRSNKDVDHTEAVEDFVEQYEGKVASVVRA